MAFPPIYTSILCSPENIFIINRFF
jgi:hypothetical protein